MNKNHRAPVKGCDCAVCHWLRNEHSPDCRRYTECRRAADLAENYRRYEAGELVFEDTGD